MSLSDAWLGEGDAAAGEAQEEAKLSPFWKVKTSLVILQSIARDLLMQILQRWVLSKSYRFFVGTMLLEP